MTEGKGGSAIQQGIALAVVTVIIALLFNSFQVQEEVSNQNVANLPGVITRVSELSDSVDRRFQALQDQIDRRFNLEIQRQIDELREELKAVRR